MAKKSRTRRQENKKLPHGTQSEILVVLTAYFILLGLILFYFQIGQASWYLLLISAIIWFAIEARGSGANLANALKVGAFLLVFDFIFENLGWLSGLWQTHSSFHVGVVPLQVMGIALFGGAAWAMYMPKKQNTLFSFCNCIIFGFFGALGEWLLIRQGLFQYHLWWTSELAFVSYFLTWAVLIFVRYKVFKD